MEPAGKGVPAGQTRVPVKEDKMRTIIAILVLCVFLQGCATFKATKTLSDGTTLYAEYIRWFNQNVDGFKLKTPDGWEVSFDKQLSETEIAFNLGALSVGAGGKKGE